MKVIYDKDCNNYLTVAEAKLAKQIIKDMREDSTKLEEIANSWSILLSGRGQVEFLSGEAFIDKDSHDMDRFASGYSVTVCVTVNFLSYEIDKNNKYRHVFYRVTGPIGAYWEMGGIDGNELKNWLYVRRFVEE